MHVTDTATLKDGVHVVNFTNNLPRNIDNSYSFCFGFIFNTLYIGDVHHAQIMNYIIEEEDKDWADLMSADQRWGWITKEGGYDGHPIRFRARYSTDDALQTPGMSDKVIASFEKYYKRDFYAENEEGYSSQDNYGQRTRVQYQGDPNREGYEYCDYCDESYDPDDEYHRQEYCPTCDEYYCSAGDPDHEYNHPGCDQCGEKYDEKNSSEVATHQNPYSYDSYEHFDHTEDNFYYDEDTTLSHRPTVSNLTDKIREYVNSVPSVKDNRDALINQMAEKYNMYRKDIAPFVDMALNPFRDQGFASPEDAAKSHYTEGLSSGWYPEAAKAQLIGWLMKYYNQQQARELADKTVADVGDYQMKLFSKWQEEEEAIDRGIHDITDYIVFARLAAMRLAGPPYPQHREGDETITFPQGDFKRLPDPWESQLPSTPVNPSTTPANTTQAPQNASEGLTGDFNENPYNYADKQEMGPEDLTLLDIEENPRSLEYRWSYDGHDLHIWQVTNRKTWGPSHYDMFGSEGYDQHSQGRVYVSPDGEVGSLYWQISHPECEDVINQWIEQTFGKPPDTVYRAYGPYKGYTTPRSYFPLVDVYNLPIPKKERWWEIPDERPPGWYRDNGMSPPNKKKRQKTTPVTVTQPPEQTTITTPENDSIQNNNWMSLNKKERRRIRRDKARSRNRGRRGWRSSSFNVITHDWESNMDTPWNHDALVQKFVFDSDGNLRVQDEPDYNYAGDIHHADLWGDLGEMIQRGDFHTPNNGFLTYEPIKMVNCDLQPGDVWFHQTPTAKEIQTVKEHFGNVKRVRWQELCDGTTGL
jgi:hypothetical protein